MFVQAWIITRFSLANKLTLFPARKQNNSCFIDFTVNSLFTLLEKTLVLFSPPLSHVCLALKSFLCVYALNTLFNLSLISFHVYILLNWWIVGE